MRLLATNYKLLKDVPGYEIYGLSLLPHALGGPNLCKFSTPECRAVCLGTETGMNRMAPAILAKSNRTALYHADRGAFVQQLAGEIDSRRRSARRKGKKLAVRLNVYSDIPWETEQPDLFHAFPDVQFYDYTKIPGRFERPENYHLTYSFSGTLASTKASHAYYDHGVNTAAVFSTKRNEALPVFVGNRLVIDGDVSDFRPRDRQGVVVGLRFKGGKANMTRAPKFVVVR